MIIGLTVDKAGGGKRNLHKEKQGILQQTESKEKILELKKIHDAISDETTTCQRETLDKQLA